jgi:hypothetical protein
VESAKRYVVEKMEADWDTKISAKWGEARMTQIGDEVTVVGFGTVSRGESATEGVFVFDVTMYTLRRIAPKVNYSVLRWSSGSPIDDRYLFDAAQIVVRQRLEADLRTSLRLDFAKPQITNPTPETRIIEGDGTFSGRGGWMTGAFKYSVRISKPLGAIERVEVTALPSNPGVGHGGHHNFFTEGVAQQHAANYVRTREGSSVQVQFTGPVTHTPISKSVDRVTGRGQWRRGNNFQWADFRYDVQVNIDDGRVVSASINLSPEIHGAAEDQKWIGFAQGAVRRDFRQQSPAQITFMSATVTAMPFGKRKVSGEFSAGGKRYGYDVIVETSNGRTERVTISPRR